MRTIIEAIQKEVEEISKENINYIDDNNKSIFTTSLLYEDAETKNYKQKIILTIDNGVKISYKIFPLEHEQHYLTSLSDKMSSLFNRTM